MKLVALVCVAAGIASAAAFTVAYWWRVRRATSAMAHYLMISSVASLALLLLFGINLILDWPGMHVLSALVGLICTGAFGARLVLMLRPERKGRTR